MRYLILLISLLFPNLTSADTTVEKLAFGCAAVGGMLYFWHSPDHAIPGPGRLTAADTKDGGIEIRNEVGLIGIFTRSSEQDEEVEELMKACQQKLNHRFEYSTELLAAFNATGLSCYKAGSTIKISDGNGQEIDLSTVTQWSKTTSTPLTLMAPGGNYALTLLSGELNALELVVGCWMQTNVIRRPVLAKTG